MEARQSAAGDNSSSQFHDDCGRPSPGTTTKGSTIAPSQITTYC